MPKVILKFNLPEEQHEFETAISADNMRMVLLEYDSWLRSNIKHAPDTMSEDTYKTYEECREILREFLIQNKINL
jgi:hypothetical protein